MKNIILPESVTMKKTAINKKKIILSIVIIAILIILLILFKNNYIFCNDVFDGDRVRNPDRYYLDFDFMNQVDSDVMMLHAGDNLHATWNIKKGDVSIEITKEDGTRIYKGDDLDKADFVIPISEDGNYTVEISAKRAKGVIEIGVVGK